MKKRWKIILGAIAVLLVAGFLVADLLRGEAVEVKRMDSEDIQHSFTEDGSVTSPDELAVHPLTSARIAELKVEEGDRVEEGDLLVVLEDEEIRCQLEQAEARLRQLEGEEEKLHEQPGEAEIKSKEIAIEQARENKRAAEREYKRIKALYEQDAVSGKELEKVENLRAEAGYHLQQRQKALQVLREKYEPPRGSEEIIEAQKEAADSQVKLLQHRLDHYRIHAPISGKVINLEAVEGGLAAPEAPLVELFSPENYKVETRVLTRDAYDISEGMTVRLTLEKREADREFTGEVIRIAPHAEKDLSPLGLEEERVTVTVLPDVPEDLRIAPGYELEVEFILEELAEQMVVPGRILFRHQGEDAVPVVENGRVRARKVTTGLETGSKVVITDGLTEGDLVIVSHRVEDIREGDRVEPVAGEK